MGDTQDQTISAIEMAEIDAAIDAQKNVQEAADPLETSYAIVRDTLIKSLSKDSALQLTDEDIEAYNQARKTLDSELWDMNINAPGILVDYVDPETAKVVLAFDSVTENIPRPSEEMRHKQTRNEVILDKFTAQSPEMNGFSLGDAVKLMSGEESAAQVRDQFKDADPNILMATAYLMLDARRDELVQSHPDFAKQHADTDFLDMASVNIFYTSQNTQKYQFWNFDRQDEFIKAVTNNDEITSRLEQIKSPVNLTSREDIQQQYTARAELVDLIAEEFSKTYGLKDFTKDDMFFAYKSLSDYQQDAQIAVAYSSTLGTKNDEAVLVTYHPIADIIRTHQSKGGMGLTDESSLNAFLKTTIEELQHTADNIYADKLLNGELDSKHPAYDHTSFHILNSMHYVGTETAGQDGYEAQHIERTAKLDANEMTFEIIFQMNHSNEDAAENAANEQSAANLYAPEPEVCARPAVMVINTESEAEAPPCVPISTPKTFSF